jgi:hypothetical protein
MFKISDKGDSWQPEFAVLGWYEAVDYFFQVNFIESFGGREVHHNNPSMS